MEEIARFYNKADAFCRFVQERELSIGDVDFLLSMLMELYVAAIKIPEMDPETEEVPPDNCGCVHYDIRFSNDFPISYLEIFNPLEDESPVGGELFDDLYDIIHDLKDGMTEYERGNIGNAVFEWKDGLRHHWGTHVVDAVKTLHWVKNT